jgi:hypothetical protein
MSIKKQHPWRICPLGENLVREHVRHTKYKVAEVSSYCRKNKSKKEILTSLEIKEIYERNKIKTKNFPSLSKKTRENKFDDIIALWTQFWNEVLKPSEPLDPNWVKTLIYTESSFDENSLNKNDPKNPAKGLMQITKATHKIITNSRGELKDVCFDTDEKENYDPNISVSMGIRWLFRKKELLKSRIKREPTWEETIWEYKGVYNDESKVAGSIKKKVREYYEEIVNNN